MAALDLQEQEQIETLKHFWNNYGSTIIIGVIAVAVGFGAIAGWKAWNAHKHVQAAKAYTPFDEAFKSEKKDLKKLGQLADGLALDFSSSAYAAQAALATAKLELAAKNAPAAQKRLEWILSSDNKDEGLLAVTRLRLAALQLDTGKLDDAIKTLQAEHPPEFDSLFAETRGDALVLKKDLVNAKLAYLSAQSTADEARKMVLDWKLQALGV